MNHKIGDSVNINEDHEGGFSQGDIAIIDQIDFFGKACLIENDSESMWMAIDEFTASEVKYVSIDDSPNTGAKAENEYLKGFEQGKSDEQERIIGLMNTKGDPKILMQYIIAGIQPEPVKKDVPA